MAAGGCACIRLCLSGHDACMHAMARANGEGGNGGAFASSDSADASDSAGGAMDEDDLFVGVMDIDEGMRAQPPRRARVDEDMSEVAEIMLNLKVCMPSRVSLDCRGCRVQGMLSCLQVLAPELQGGYEVKQSMRAPGPCGCPSAAAC